MVKIPFAEPLDDVVYGESVRVSPLIRRVIAHNPSKFTYRGTGTYIVGNGEVVVIDPGPILDTHRTALMAALAGEKVVGIVATHCHADHSPLAQWLKEETGAPTYAFGPHADVVAEDDDAEDDDAENDDGDTVNNDAESNTVREHVDTEFVPDVYVSDGDVFIARDGWSLSGVFTPGHTSNHLCVALDVEQALFTGDHVMGWSTTVISPPDGNMADYFSSLRKVQARSDSILWPTHGNPVHNPEEFLVAYLRHREEREADILAMVRSGVCDITTIVGHLYRDVNKELHKAAGRSVRAHLVKLVAESLVAVEGGGEARRSSRYQAV